MVAATGTGTVGEGLRVANMIPIIMASSMLHHWQEPVFRELLGLIDQKNVLVEVAGALHPRKSYV
ncbi:hypothetical protein SAY87_022213 [Trapa incisa]|uniref:Uncharacterized protein n=1 Tax=Trapa incisa TaxID=236973 RepID=A0AAN7JVD7_9MYRT|nr:hypothetical protein SAY87_022213 [Trapa incisa]